MLYEVITFGVVGLANAGAVAATAVAELRSAAVIRPASGAAGTPRRRAAAAANSYNFV